MDSIYSSTHLHRKEYKVSVAEQNESLKKLDKRADAEAARIKRYLAMPDLSRTPGSPLCEIVQSVLDLPGGNAKPEGRWQSGVLEGIR